MGYKLTTPVAVSYGDETFFLDRDLTLFRDQPQAHVTLLDGSEASEAEVISVCETFRVDFDDPDTIKPRVVVVDNGQKLKPEKALKSYIEGREASYTGAVLAVLIRSEKCPSFWTKFGPKVKIREHKKLKTWDNNNEVVKWVQTEADRIGLNLSPQLANSMFQIAGSDLYILSSELRKLRLLVGAKDPVTVKHLQLVMTPASNLGSWDLADAVFLKNQRRAMNVLTSLYRFASEDPTLMIHGALVKSSERLFVARSMVNRGAGEEEVAARFSMHPFRYRMSLLPQVEKQTLPGLARTMQILSKLDVELKRTSHRRTLLEVAVLDLAT